MTLAEREYFAQRGLLRLRAFSSQEAAAMQGAVWQELRRAHGIERDRPATWRIELPAGLRAIPEAPAFLPIAGAATRAVIDELLGAGSWDAPKRWGAFHVTFPAGRRWTVPHTLWHADFPFDLPAEPLPGVKVFVFVSDVPPGAGGTLVVAGSHRLSRRRIDAAPPALRADTRRMRLHILASHPWLQALTSAAYDEDRVARFMATAEDADGVALQVVELSGAAGEIVVTHPWLLHCRAINAGTAPRFMRSIDLYRRELHPAVFRASQPGTT